VTLPKIELHVHLEGAIRPHTLLEIARRNGERLPAATAEGLAAMYEFTDFAHFIDVWILTTNCLRTRADFKQVALGYAAEAAGHGAVYVEAIFSPGERVMRGVSWDDVFGGYTDAVDEAEDRFGVTLRLTPDLFRGLATDLAEEAARVAVRYADRGVVGLGLGGAETEPAEPYRKPFAIARDGGLGIVPHAGEAGGPESIREVLTMDPDRLRHGIRAVEDPDVLAEIVERGLILDVCPTSNLRTRVVGSLDEHPLRRLRAVGVRCTINTDDPAMFGTDLTNEYAVAESLGVSAADAFAAGVAGALCDPATKAHLVEIGRVAYDQPPS
jgi:aminodeoxyfutalosine deaminase